MPPDVRLSRRATTPAVAVVLLVLVTIFVAAAVGATVETTISDPVPTTDLRLRVDADADRLSIRHAGGDELNASALRLRMRVDGQELTHQPPVPFFAARGFRSGPTGPFNPAGGTTWRAGQRASLRLASTNSPGIAAGDRVVVTVTSEQGRVARLEATAR